MSGISAVSGCYVFSRRHLGDSLVPHGGAMEGLGLRCSGLGLSSSRPSPALEATWRHVSHPKSSVMELLEAVVSF